jgi:transposase InsO family protein
MCHALGVSVSGYYAAQHRPPSARQATEARLRVEIRAEHAKSRRRYGAPRVHRELRAQGTHVAKKRVARLMREEGLVARPKRRFVRTTDATHAYPLAPNVLARHFAVETRLNQVWVSDLTYVPTRAGWLYLAVVLDLASRRVIGWAMRASLHEALTLNALQMALAQRRPAAGLLHHSDRGVHYASGTYRAILAAHAVTSSMSRPRDCWDNAVAESFFATLEHELLAVNDFPTHEAARRAIFEFIEVWYNRQRRHSSLDYLSPVQYEEQHHVA